jgi:hypothetical protein
MTDAGLDPTQLLDKIILGEQPQMHAIHDREVYGERGKMGQMSWRRSKGEEDAEGARVEKVLDDGGGYPPCLRVWGWRWRSLHMLQGSIKENGTCGSQIYREGDAPCAASHMCL